MDTFLAESGRSEFSFRLLIATTNLIGRTAKRTIEAQEKQASVLLLGDLEAAEVDWPSSPLDLHVGFPAVCADSGTVGEPIGVLAWLV